MSQLSTTSVMSLRDLSPHQKKFISSRGPDPGNRSAVEEFTKQFRREFNIKVPWKTMRRFITQVRRNERRNGWRDTIPETARATQSSANKPAPVKSAPVFRTGNHAACSVRVSP